MTKRRPQPPAQSSAPPAPAPAEQPAEPAPARSPLIDRLVAWRRAQGLTQKETAERLGISFRTLAGYECGQRGPGGPNTAKILALTGALKP